MAKNEKKQKETATYLFIGLVVVFIVCVPLLLSVENKWWPGIQSLSDKQYQTLAPLKWALASLIGAALYLLGQIANFYPKINEKPDPDNQNDFIKSIYWYISTLLRAPILTVVIMWLLTNLRIDLGKSDVDNTFGVAVDFSKLPDFVNIGIAFILGFYGRVARKQLDIIAQYLFTRAWAMAQMGFEVSASSPDIILLKDTYTFKTDPVMDVVWTSNIGTMEAGTGTYKAPEDASSHDSDLIVRAQLRSEPSVTQFKLIKLRLFKIIGKATAQPKEIITFNLESKIDDSDLKNAKWTCDGGGTPATATGKEFKVTMPDEKSVGTEKQVNVTAKVNYKGKDCLVEHKILVKP